MALTIGIVGLPNVGKSTLFNALTKNDVLAANYPFATIEPNVGVVNLPDARLDRLAALFHSERIVPATVSFVDIAGIPVELLGTHPEAENLRARDQGRHPGYGRRRYPGSGAAAATTLDPRESHPRHRRSAQRR